MAIDTANKRFSMLGFCDSIDASLPVPDGDLDAGDRMQYLAVYRGLFEEATTTGAAMQMYYFHAPLRRRRRRLGGSA